MKPTDALEAQAYFKGKCQDANWRRLLASWIDITSGMKYRTDEYNQKYKDLRIKMWQDDIVSTGLSAECFFVKEEMTDLIRFASSKLDDTDVADFDLCPADNGFAYFEKPLPVRDVRGRTLFINIIMWKKVFNPDGKLCISYSCWNDASRTPDEIAITLDKEQNLATQTLGKFHWLSMNTIFPDQVIGKETIELDEKRLAEIKETTFRLQNLEKTEIFSEDEWERYKEEVIKEPTNMTRLLHAYWLLMSQTLTSVSKERGDRAQRRRLEREKLPTEVVVVQFRKRRYVSADTDETHEESAVEWSHRWIVGGHWRWQPYKDPVSKGVIKKRIWISPYVKGPEDKPLVAKSKVFVLAK